MDTDTIIILAVIGLGGLAVLSDPSRVGEIIRVVIDAIHRKRK